MSSIQAAQVSMVRCATDTETKPSTVQAVLSAIRAGRWKEEVEAVRRAYADKGKAAADSLKTNLPGVLFSGTFSRRKKECLIQHSGVLCLDCDGLNGRLEEVRPMIEADQHVLASFLSPSGTGLKVVLSIDANPLKHEDNFRAAEIYFREHFGITVDPACKDVSRICFVSYDPAALVRPDAIPLPVEPPSTTTAAEPGRVRPAAKSAQRNDMAPYVRSAVDGETEAVANAVEGQRNVQLNTSAFNLGQLVGAAVLERADAEAILSDAARNCGLPDHESARTIQSGLDSGAKQPRQIPETPHVTIGGSGPKLGAKAEPSGPPDTWATPEPFSSADVPLAPWPWEVFPPVLADLGREIVRTIGTCDELPGLGLLCVASIALRNKIKVQIKQGHTQHANLYGLAILPPGQKKTPVGKVLLPPFTDWQKEQGEVHRDALNKWEARARIARARVAKMEKAAGDANDEQAQGLQQEIEEQQKVLKVKPVKPCLFTNDATSERVAGLMSEHGGAMGVFTTEGRKVLAIARGRYTKGSGSDIDLWLAAYSGDYIRVDRNKEGHEPIELPEPVLSAFVAAQPDTLRALGENEEIRASGFLARWDYICPDANTGAEYRTASIAPHIHRAYADAIRRLIDLPYAVFPDGSPAPHLIGFTLDAFQRWTAYHNELAAEASRSLGSKPTAFVEWMGKLPERVARIAGIFRAVRHVAEGVPLGAIDAPEIDAAYMVTLALLTHGKRAFGMMGQDADQARARCLWRAIDERRVKLRNEREREGLGRIEAVKPKDVARNGWAGIEKTDEARRVLEVLSTKGWLSDAVTLPGKARGQQHDLYYMRPDSPTDGGKP
jgi:hypothetical protein